MKQTNYLDKSVVELHFYLDTSVIELHFYLDKSVKVCFMWYIFVSYKKCFNFVVEGKY